MKKVIFVVLFFITLLLLDGFFINSHGFKTEVNNILIDNLPDSFQGFKIMQISDFLIEKKDDLDRIKDIVAKINERKPDVVVFTGGLLSTSYKLDENDINTLSNYLKEIDVTLYKYSIYGDEDIKNKEIFDLVMNDANFILLDNESKYLFYKDNLPIKITGLNKGDIDSAFVMDDILDVATNIVLTHYPDDVDKLSGDNIIVLAGGSLKGQVRVPFVGGIIKGDGYMKYTDSFYEIDNKLLFNSGGIGTKKVRFRLFNKPEINLYRLEKK